jgi:hypothetical protein
MEEPREIAQQPLEKAPAASIPAPDKTVPQPETDFGDETFDSTPIRRGGAGGFNEWIFSMMRPKKKVAAVPRQTTPRGPVRPMMRPEPGLEAIPNADIPKGFEVQNGLLFRKKTIPERVRDQLRFPIIKSSASMINGIALAVFAVGAYLLYSALPTRPDLVLGIILVSAAGNLIMNNR